MPQCKICGKNCEKEWCFRHKPRVKKEEDIEEITRMRDFFYKIWEERRHNSEVSGTYLGKEPLTVFFHHILSKEKYPQARLDEQNIILLTLDEHTAVENDMYKYEKINELRKQLLEKYNQ